MNNIVITLFKPSPLYNKLAEVTHPLMRNYAQKIGADFQIVDNFDPSRHEHLMYCKLDFVDFLQTYDRVLYVDSDVIIRSNAPNIFEDVPYEYLGMFDEARPCMNGCFPRYVKVYNEYARSRGAEEFNIDLWDGRYFNAGVMVFSKHHVNCPIFHQPVVELTQEDLFREQSYFNLMIQKYGVEMHDLTLKWNGMGSGLCQNIKEEDRLKSHFIHVIGAHVDKLGFLEKIKASIGDF